MPKQFWQALERTPGLAAAAAEWRAALGPDWEWGQSLLRPTQQQAESIMLPGGLHRVVAHARDRMVAVPVEGGRAQPVALADVAVKKGILGWSTVEGLLKTEAAPVIGESLASMQRILKAGRDAIPAGLPDDIYASAFRTAAIGAVVEASVKAFKTHYDSIMAGTYPGELVDDCEAVALVKVLKKIGRTRVYCTPSNLKLELMGRRVICDLMDVFWEGARVLPTTEAPKAKTFPGKAGALLSENYRRVFQESIRTGSSLPESYLRLQLVTDHVCGMTDSFAKRLHAELMNG